MLAKNFGWTEYFILWELPLVRGNAYMHAMLRAHNIATRYMKEEPPDDPI